VPLTYANRGLVYDDRREYDRALQDFNRAIQLYPWAFTYRGITYRKKGEYDRAIKDFDEAIRIDPKVATYYSNRAIAYSNKGEYDRSIEDFDLAIRLDPKDAIALAEPPGIWGFADPCCCRHRPHRSKGIGHVQHRQELFDVGAPYYGAGSGVRLNPGQPACMAG
jgi:tetratricopeptide (TPR) repeat protein